MLSLIFYLIILLALGGIIFLFCYRRRGKRKSQVRIHEPKIDLNLDLDSSDAVSINETNIESEQVLDNPKEDNLNDHSPYASDLVILHLNAFANNPYMGYELHQALLASGLQLGEMNIFHRYADDDKQVLFSLAAATPEGSFIIEDMGSFKCNGLVLFMKLDPKRKLMMSFDLMLDAARQLVEELGGEIYDDLRQPINAEVIKRLREKICNVETSNLYVSDLLDNLD